MHQSTDQPLVQLFSRVGSGAAEPAIVESFATLFDAVNGLFEFPRTAVLLWLGCMRQEEHYDFPPGLKAKWKGRRCGRLDYRMRNGPPNSAFSLGGGVKPSGWELDHIYDEEPLWSVRDGLHFTQSAGLVAMPRNAHRQRHSDAKLSWLVRGFAFLKFGYDPLAVFSAEPHDQFGFVAGRRCEVFWPEPNEQ